MSTCFLGPPFNISGNRFLPEDTFSFTLEFDNPSDQNDILAYEWYLDNVLMIEEGSIQVTAKALTGKHFIGVRVLNNQGWSGLKEFDFYTNVMPDLLVVEGPDTVNEGDVATYEAYLHFGNQEIVKVTDKAVFSINTGGTFDSNLLTTYNDVTSFEDKNAVVTASVYNVSGTKNLTILNTTKKYPAVLVVDIFDVSTLNIGALIANPDVNNGQVLAYTGNNFIPANATPNDALILASDYINNGSSLKWRFQFNILKIVNQYPNIKDFVFEVRARSNSARILYGAYGLKTYDTKMVMYGAPGSFIPTVTGGGNVGGPVNYQTSVSAGANGNYNKDYLLTILKFNFNVQNSILTVTKNS
ncbi:hypothetical protein [Pedobacter montanisoli]|uniref:Uncharacterized protein n=1 Tax=Pedobacter montanisoli TaxID=2923277 RepID=A0ABS9ZXW3_9SPHI|nr:hypothetical protein [Pedobacter montanisoli]MCJ0743122.1 hypothetical protein [Pedobacter montanisoli]